MHFAGAGLNEYAVSYSTEDDVGGFLFFFGCERAEQVSNGYLLLGFAQSGEAADFLHDL